MPDDFDRARKYIASVPPAGQGNRNDGLNRLAYAVLERFHLSQPDFESLLLEWAGSCSPAMHEAEALKTARSAWTGANAKGAFGSKAREPRPGYPHSARPARTPASPKPAPKRYDLSGGQELPGAVADGARLLLKACFAAGEGVRIVNAKLDDEKGGEVPDGAGPCLSREEWLRKLDRARGNPNGIFSSTKKTGIYIGLNPYKIGGSRDSDVTAYRHALVEFDEGLSPEAQYELYVQSQLPCAAIIYSGGKSVHAWVKIDARDRREYDERVRQLYSHFEASGYPLDAHNRNPGRLSRLPNCVRFDKRQELLALNVGCESFSEWLKSIDAESLGKCDRFSDLIALDTSHDPNCVIGFHDGRTLRYLCKGKSAWILGPSGVGKSSLISEFAIAWALGKPAYGISPGARPLKSLIVQAENDRYDLAEMVQGISRAHGLDPFKTEESFDQVDENVLFKTEDCSTGEAFVERLHRLLDRERPDICWLDPFLSFAGIEVSRQDQVTHFLRDLVNPVLRATGVVMIGVHHTGKPKNSRETANWNAIDWAYAGLGSSELVNWARAVMMLRPASDIQFELKLAKRGKRAWATGLDGEFTTSIWLQHSAKDIRWEQIAAPEEAKESKEDRRGGKPSDVQRIAAMNLHSFLAACPDDGEGKNECAKRLRAWLAAVPEDRHISTCKRIIEALVSNGKLKINQDDKYIKGPNA